LGARIALTLGALLGFLMVVTGGYGAHVLRSSLAPGAYATWQTAFQFHAWHALALIAVGTLLLKWPASRTLRLSALLFVAGIVCFSGSLYVLALGADRLVAWVTPIGGVTLMLGWLLECLACAGCLSRPLARLSLNSARRLVIRVKRAAVAAAALSL